jgi:hypothetical protein
MANLEAKGLMIHVRRRRQSNLYRFLWHPIFEVQPTAPESCNSSLNLNLEKGISSSSEPSPAQESATAKPTDDESLSSFPESLQSR